MKASNILISVLLSFYSFLKGKPKNIEAIIGSEDKLMHDLDKWCGVRGEQSKSWLQGGFKAKNIWDLMKNLFKAISLDQQIGGPKFKRIQLSHFIFYLNLLQIRNRAVIHFQNCNFFLELCRV